MFDMKSATKVFLKVLPSKKVMRFGKNGKLSPRFIGPYEVIEKVGPIAYLLALPPDLEKIHNVFHLSMLRRDRSDPSHVISSETIELRPDLSYEEEPMEILAHEVKELWNKKILLVKVLWKNHKTKKPLEKVKKRCGSSICNYLTKVNFKDEIFLSPINSPRIPPPKLSRVFPLEK